MKLLQQLSASSSFKLGLIISQIFFYSYAQTIRPPNTSDRKVSGVVSDSVTKSPIAFATITLTDPADNRRLKSVMAESDGSFEISCPVNNNLLLSISSTGYKTRTIQLMRFTSNVMYLGKQFLSRIDYQLEEVHIISKRQMIEFNPTKLIYNVYLDPDNKTSNAFEILQKVPMLTVDSDNKLQLNGSTHFKVLINGKASSLFLQNVSDVFKTMPASMIMKIEVMKNPPARYASEGLAGVLNIITYHGIKGYNASVTLSGDNQESYNTGAYVTARTGKLGIAINGANNYTTNPKAITDFSRIDNITHNAILQHGETYTDTRSKFLFTDLSFDLDTLNLFTAGLNANDGKSVSDFQQNASIENSISGSKTAYLNTNHSISRWNGYDLEFNFQHTGKNVKEKLLAVSYKLTSNENNGLINILQQPIINYHLQKSISDNSNTFTERTVQADFSEPLEDHLLEIGIKSISRKTTSNYGYANFDTITGNLVNDTTLANNYNNTQNVNALYLSITFNKENWAFITSARVEGTNIRNNFKSSRSSSSQQYLNLLPSVTISHQLKNGDNIAFSYAQRIERPGVFYLDPFIDFSDPRNIYFGNPFLVPAATNAVDLSYFTTWKRISVNANLFHQFSNNSIERYTAIRKDSVAYTTFGNVGRSKSYGISLGINASLLKSLNLALNGSYNHTKFAGKKISGLLENKGENVNLFLYLSYRFLKTFRFNSNLSYNSSEVILQGSRSGYFSGSLSVTKEFFKQKNASLAFTANNPFQNSRLQETEIMDASFHQLQRSQSIIRRFTLSFNYRFGKLKEDISRKKRGIKNDDLLYQPD